MKLQFGTAYYTSSRGKCHEYVSTVAYYFYEQNDESRELIETNFAVLIKHELINNLEFHALSILHSYLLDHAANSYLKRLNKIIFFI